MPPKASVKGNQLDMNNVSSEFANSSDIDIFIDRFLNHPDFPLFICDLLYPVGKSKYIQIAGENGEWDESEDPEVKFPGTTWVKIFDNEGTFFKTEGHEPTQYYKNNVLTAYRTNGLAEDKIQLLIGEVNQFYPGYGLLLRNQAVLSGVFKHGGNVSAGNQGQSYSASGLAFDSKGSPNARTTVDTEGRTEPVNRLIRIWERRG